MVSLGFIIGCADQVQNSYPVVTLPEDADLESPTWKGIDLEPKPPVLAKSVEGELESFQLPPGYKLEPILTEPQIKQPAAINFDANGRLLVMELRTYMLTADADGELEPGNIISRWEDKDNDGVYETGTVFVDSLVFPRFVMPWGEDGVLTMESNQDDIFLYTDTDGDGRCDTKEFFAGDFGRSGNVEHQQAFLYHSMDNWLYSTVNAFRIRWTPKGILRENTGYNRAQWGATQDNEGKMWFQGGASGVPSYFQFPIHYGNFDVDDELAEGFRKSWGLPMGLEDVQPGMQAVRRPDGSLDEVTGAAGNDIFRGHRLPEAMVGQLFYGEPVGRMVRQILPIKKEGLTQLHNYHQDFKKEFILSSDPLFRPVDLATAPDGTMYIADMYRGIIQEGQLVMKGSYLRTKIDQFQLDKIINLGRLWRLTYEGIRRDEQKPQMGSETPAQLIKHFNHPNGWWRDMAQQELVRRQDHSVVGELLKMTGPENKMLARFHAMWTLEGLDAIDLDLMRTLFGDEDPKIRRMAIQVSETLYKAGENQLIADYVKLTNDPNVDVVLQSILTMNILEVPNVMEIIERTMAKNGARGIQVVGSQILEDRQGGEKLVDTDDFSEEELALIRKGSGIYQELCSTCHGVRGAGVVSGDGLMAPPLANSGRVSDHEDYIVKVILRGMVGEVDGIAYTGGFMAPMAGESDEWIAAVSSYVRTQMGNKAHPVTAEEVSAIRAVTEDLKPYAFEELTSTATMRLVPTDEWIVTASHTKPMRVGGSGLPYGALTFEGWTSGVAQEKGMWFQIEVPKAVEFNELYFESRTIRRGRGPNDPPPLQTGPKSYEIRTSMDGDSWSDPVAVGSCETSATRIVLKPSVGRYLKIIQTGLPEAEEPWQMEELYLYGRQGGFNL